MVDSEKLKVWWHDAIFYILLEIHSFQHIHTVHSSIAVLYLFITGQLSEKKLPGMSRIEFGLPYSQSMH
jgi:hypothetical protein